ncbi:MAG: hypothetical protein PHX04_04310 [Bacilli bacterium]|nr:hypothetical protein [Bacilli bacterium]
MDDYIEPINEKEREKNHKKNEKYLIEFRDWSSNIDNIKSYQYLKDANFYFLTYLSLRNTNNMEEGSN